MPHLGYESTQVHRDRIRKAALIRESMRQRKVWINGKVYDNLTRAEQATGISARSLKRYILSDNPKHAAYQYL